MVKIHNRTIGAIIVLFMLGTAQLSVNYSFAEIDENQVSKDKEDLKKERLRAILTEKIVDGKLQVQRYSLPEDTSEEDLQRILSFEGHSTGWAYVNYKTYNSGIVLFDGKASKIGDNLWKISANGKMDLGESKFDLELSGKSNGSHVVLHGTASNEELSYKVIFSGKLSNTDEENVYAFSMMNSGLKNPETGQNIKLLQIGEIILNSEKTIGSFNEFKNSISVR